MIGPDPLINRQAPGDTAFMYVLDATGEGVGTQGGIPSAAREVFERLWARIDSPVPDRAPNFVDRPGEQH